MAQEDSFLSRWSRRKVQQTQAESAPGADAELAPAALTPVAETTPTRRVEAEAGAGLRAQPDVHTDTEVRLPPPPTLEEARQLTPDADFTRFVARDVDPQVKNAALKTLFSDPQFNVMDGLDIYIDDYGKPDPLPAGMLERMTQSAFLGLFRQTPEEEAAARVQAELQAQPPAPAGAPGDAPSDASATSTAPAAPPALTAPTDPQEPPLNEDPDLRLQRHDDAGRPGPGQGTEPDPGGQR